MYGGDFVGVCGYGCIYGVECVEYCIDCYDCVDYFVEDVDQFGQFVVLFVVVDVGGFYVQFQVWVGSDGCFELIEVSFVFGVYVD